MSLSLNEFGLEFQPLRKIVTELNDSRLCEEPIYIRGKDGIELLELFLNAIENLPNKQIPKLPASTRIYYDSLPDRVFSMDGFSSLRKMSDHYTSCIEKLVNEKNMSRDKIAKHLKISVYSVNNILRVLREEGRVEQPENCKCRVSKSSPQPEQFVNNYFNEEEICKIIELKNNAFTIGDIASILKKEETKVRTKYVHLRKYGMFDEKPPVSKKEAESVIEIADSEQKADEGREVINKNIPTSMLDKVVNELENADIEKEIGTMFAADGWDVHFLITLQKNLPRLKQANTILLTIEIMSHSQQQARPNRCAHH